MKKLLLLYYSQFLPENQVFLFNLYAKLCIFCIYKLFWSFISIKFYYFYARTNFTVSKIHPQISAFYFV